MRIVLVGGGTGGHFNPLIAVAEVLNTYEKPPQLYYFGPEPYNQTTLDENNIKYVYCPAGKVRIYASIQNFFDLFVTFFGFWFALIKLYIIYPDVIFSKGSFTSVPVLLAAKLLRIPVVIHESDAVPGRANLLAKNFARFIAISYNDAAPFFPQEKTALTGIPLRKILLTPHPDPFSVLGIPPDLPLIYVTGGSSGAERINNLVLRCLDTLLPHYRIFHQTGEKNFDQLKLAAKSLVTDPIQQSRYYPHSSVSPEIVSALLTAASIVVTRAGSTTLFEIAIHGKPSIVIPIPEDISRDQRSNAYAFARAGGAVVIEERNLTEALLTSEIHSIMQNPQLYQEMSQAAVNFAHRDAAHKIATSLIFIGKEHGSYQP